MQIKRTKIITNKSKYFFNYLIYLATGLKAIKEKVAFGENCLINWYKLIKWLAFINNKI